MSPHNYQLKRGTALVIVGPQGCGKTTAAQSIALRHGKYQQIETGPTWDFQLRDALNGHPDVLIVDGVPVQNEMVDIKCIVTEPTMQVRQPYSGHREAIPCPFVAICALDANWIPEGLRRLDVIDLSNGWEIA